MLFCNTREQQPLYYTNINASIKPVKDAAPWSYPRSQWKLKYLAFNPENKILMISAFLSKKTHNLKLKC